MNEVFAARGTREREASAAGAAPGETIVRAGKLSDQVYEVILRNIAVGRYPVDARLPSEQALCALLDVSRPVVREALARLRADGVVSSRRGSGSFVRRRPSDAFIQFAPSGNVAEVLRCYQFRVGIEGEAARHAARLCTPADLRVLRETIERFEQAAAAGDSKAEADRAFHYAVAATSGNALFVTALHGVDHAMREGIQLAQLLARLRDDDRLVLVQKEHATVYDAIAARDPDRAAAAMRHHIEMSRRRLIGGAAP